MLTLEREGGGCKKNCKMDGGVLDIVELVGPESLFAQCSIEKPPAFMNPRSQINDRLRRPRKFTAGWYKVITFQMSLFSSS